MIHSVTKLVLLANVALLLGLAAVALRNRTEPSARVFGVLQTLSAVWAALTIAGLSVPDGPLRVRLWGATTGLSLLVVSFWLAFILRYTGRDRWLTIPRFGVASIPLVAGAALYFLAPSWQPLVGQLDQAAIPAGTVVQSGIGPVGAVLGVYIYLVFLTGLVLVVRTVLAGNELFVGQAIALVAGTLVTVVGSALAIAGVPVAGYPVTQVALGGQSVLWGYAVFRQQFIRLVPAVARLGERTVFDELDDGVLVCDTTGTIIRANPQARAYLDAETLVGEPVAVLFDRLGVSGFEELPTRFEGPGGTYQVKSSTVTNRRSEPIGRALVIRDISRLVRRQQRLQVLNRVLRHNVRNEMNVVLANGERLQTREDATLNEIGETLSRRADALTAVSEKALAIERLAERPIETERIDLPAFVDETVSRLGERYPDATITASVGASRVHTDRRVLSLVFEEVLKNALIHAGDAPTVTVEVSRRDDGVEIAVSDDGPGIPQIEIEAVEDGVETDLRHGSSLGLWLVYWGARALGGDVDIAASETGSTVTLSIRDAREQGTPAAAEPDVAGAG